MSSTQYIRGSITGGTENSVASADVPMDGTIVAVYLFGNGDIDTDADLLIIQLSFGSTGTTTNDSRQVIAEARAQLHFTTSGAAQVAINQMFTYGNGLPVGMGERLHLHSLSSASLSGSVVALVVYNFDEPRAAMRRR